MIKNLEQGFKFNRQFFAPDDGANIGAESISTPALEPSVSDLGQAATQPNGEQPASFAQYAKVDINSIPEQLRPILQEKISNIDKTFTQTMQEIAPVRKLMEQSGMTADQISQAIEITKYISENPGDAFVELAERVGVNQAFNQLVQKVGYLAAMQMMTQGMGQVNQQPEPDPFAEDDYAQKLIQVAKAEAIKEYEQKYGTKIQTLEQAEQARKNEALETRIDTNIKKALEGFEETGITHEQVKRILIEKRYTPENAEKAVIDAMGGLGNYNTYLTNKAIASYIAKAKEQNQNVSTTVTNGVPVSQTIDPSKLSWDQLRQVIAQNLSQQRQT
jgi:hypothetical protein